MAKYSITYGVTPVGLEVWTVWKVKPAEYRLLSGNIGEEFYWDPPAVCHSQEAAEAALRLLSL